MRERSPVKEIRKRIVVGLFEKDRKFQRHDSPMASVRNVADKEYYSGGTGREWQMMLNNQSHPIPLQTRFCRLRL